MIILKVEKLKKLQNSFLNKKTLLYILILFCFTSKIYGQESVKEWYTPFKIGILYNSANEKTFLADDPDYYYKTSVIKGQFYYKLKEFNKFDLELIVQPQFQRIKHQLLNPWFVTNDFGNNLQEKKEQYTQLKTIYFYAFELGFSANFKVVSKLDFKVTAGLGMGYLDTVTERVAKGFTFLENLSLGFSYLYTKKTELYFGGNIGHVSNLNFQFPNSGYNVIGLEYGISYYLN
jgi:hypothetical protein